MSYHDIRYVVLDIRMSILSSIDTSQFTTPYAAAQEVSLFNQSLPTKEEAKQETPNAAALDSYTPKVDLNNYYSNVQPVHVNSDIGSDLAQASENFNNAVSDAIQKGINPQTAVNIQKAKSAYQAMMNVYQTTTFELEIE